MVPIAVLRTRKYVDRCRVPKKHSAMGRSLPRADSPLLDTDLRRRNLVTTGKKTTRR